MGTSLLAAAATEALPVKNTFIHFDTTACDRPVRKQLGRCQTDPSPTPRGWVEAMLPSISTEVVQEESPTPPATRSMSGQSLCKENVVPPCRDTTSSSTIEEKKVTSTSTWQIDGRKFKGKDTRLSTPMQMQVDGGIIEFVVSIFPKIVSQKRGGANFKAANGVGFIEVKYNEIPDSGFRVSLHFGGDICPRSYTHDFAENPIAKIPGEWDFQACLRGKVDPASLVITVAMTTASTPPQLSSSGYPPNVDVDENEHSRVVGLPLEVLQPRHFCPWPSESEESEPFCIYTPPQTPTLQGRISPWSDWTPDAVASWTSELCFCQSTPVMAAPTSMAPIVVVDDASVYFSFTIRRADSVSLGLDVERHEDFLLIKAVLSGGAIEAWNKQMDIVPCGAKVVLPGDYLVSVNGQVGCDNMLKECKDKYLLKLVMLRRCATQSVTYHYGQEWDYGMYFSPQAMVTDPPAMVTDCKSEQTYLDSSRLPTDGVVVDSKPLDSNAGEEVETLTYGTPSIASTDWSSDQMWVDGVWDEEIPMANAAAEEESGWSSHESNGTD